MRVTMILLLLLALASPAIAQVPALCFYADTTLTSCALVDTTRGMLRIHVVHTPEAGATAVEFRVPVPDCMKGAVWLRDDTAMPVKIGDSQNGIAIAYGRCIDEPTLVLTITLLASGESERDCALRFFGKQEGGAIHTVTCDRKKVETPGGVSYINSGKPCECGEAAEE